MTFLSFLSDRIRWMRIRRSGLPPVHEVRVSYGYSFMPAAGGKVSGGLAKFMYLLSRFPHSPRCFNILYLGSSSLPLDWKVQIELAREKGACIIWNQDGVAYPAWAGSNTEKINAYLRMGLHASDYVFYQSEFCKRSADEFLGEFKGRSEILYNPVDVNLFRPSEPALPVRSPRILTAGTIKSFERFKLAVQAFFLVHAQCPGARLQVAGKLGWHPDSQVAMAQATELLRELGILTRVKFELNYSRSQAPHVFRKAHIMLHTKVMDPCPCSVLEAMASGLPVIYLDNGGMPELVGNTAGVGVPDGSDYNMQRSVSPEVMADAVMKVWSRLATYADAARRRAVEKFSAVGWVDRHVEVFSSLLDQTVRRQEEGR